VVETVSRGTVRKVRFENKASATAPASNNRLSEFLRTFLIKAVLFSLTKSLPRIDQSRSRNAGYEWIGALFASGGLVKPGASRRVYPRKKISDYCFHCFIF
jgi:hypothetical protein